MWFLPSMEEDARMSPPYFLYRQLFSKGLLDLYSSA